MSTEPSEQLRALRAVVGLYYDEAERLDGELGVNRVPRLKSAMRVYLSAFS